jgi:hypothetical protein
MTVIYAIAAALVIFALLYWLWARRMTRELAETAALEWRRLAESEPELVAGLDERRFRRAFHRAHFPRFPKYALACVAGFMLALPITFAALAGLAWAIDSIGYAAQADEIARSVPVAGAARAVARDDGETIALYYVQDVLRFYYFFGLLFAWLAVVFVAMRRYHLRRPGPLREEIEKEKAVR